MLALTLQFPVISLLLLLQDLVIAAMFILRKTLSNEKAFRRVIVEESESIKRMLLTARLPFASVKVPLTSDSSSLNMSLIRLSPLGHCLFFPIDFAQDHSKLSKHGEYFSSAGWYILRLPDVTP